MPSINEYDLTLKVKDAVLDSLLSEPAKLRRQLEFAVLKKCVEFTSTIGEFLDKEIEEQQKEQK